MSDNIYWYVFERKYRYTNCHDIAPNVCKQKQANNICVVAFYLMITGVLCYIVFLFFVS